MVAVRIPDLPRFRETDSTAVNLKGRNEAPSIHHRKGRQGIGRDSMHRGWPLECKRAKKDLTEDL